MYKLRMHAGVMRKLLHGCAYVREIIHSLKLVDYLPVHTHKPYNSLHLFFTLAGKVNDIKPAHFAQVLHFVHFNDCKHGNALSQPLSVILSGQHMIIWY